MERKNYMLDLKIDHNKCEKTEIIEHVSAHKGTKWEINKNKVSRISLNIWKLNIVRMLDTVPHITEIIFFYNHFFLFFRLDKFYWSVFKLTNLLLYSL